MSEECVLPDSPTDFLPDTLPSLTSPSPLGQPSPSPASQPLPSDHEVLPLPEAERGKPPYPSVPRPRLGTDGHLRDTGSQPPLQQTNRKRPARLGCRTASVRAGIAEEVKSSRIKYSSCRRQGHSREECPKRITCEYCQGRFHSAQSCGE
ncbi:hypothetical protein E2C01_058561 [Portunus trituberculatus]|uniref:CCHC-type domain-containing protein n=1 Tax=Portunus trituberculatus TaxID=210409 RepID=A0A5B7H3I6_PORTR|nr:hypothetical protein [Portunus trituberculatus]